MVMTITAATAITTTPRTIPTIHPVDEAVTAVIYESSSSTPSAVTSTAPPSQLLPHQRRYPPGQIVSSQPLCEDSVSARP